MRRVGLTVLPRKTGRMPLTKDSVTKDSAATASAPTPSTPSLADVAQNRRAFDPAPSRSTVVDVVVARSAPAAVGAIGIPLGTKGAVPRLIGLDRATLAAAG